MNGDAIEFFRLFGNKKRIPSKGYSLKSDKSVLLFRSVCVFETVLYTFYKLDVP